jgi:UDP-glucose 4-epimerase
MSKILVTGGAGFIGSNLIKDLVASGNEVKCIDSMVYGYRELLSGIDIEIVQSDLSDINILDNKIFTNVDEIIHLAADVDNRFAWENPSRLIQNNINATMNMGLAAVKYGINKITYSSTGTVYGDCLTPPFKEEYESSNQTTIYGATKYSGESLLAVFSTHHDIKVKVLRFVSVLGPGYTHGHIFDFVRSLKNNPKILNVLGNGMQKKSYVHVSDVVRAIQMDLSNDNYQVFNLGRPDFSTVKDSVKWVCEEMNIEPEIYYGTEDRGWIGDNPFLQLDISKISQHKWIPKKSIEESVRETVTWLLNNNWVFDLSKRNF